MPSPMRLLFVCHANLIRSPLAENLFRRMVEEKGLGGKYACDSAGTSVYNPGSPPHPSMRETAELHGLSLTGESRPFQPTDFNRFDLILAADRDVAADLRGWAPGEGSRARIRLLTEFDSKGGRGGIPDPFGGGGAAFEATYQAIERAVAGLLEWLEAGSPARPARRRR
jgi:protein-tyrosine phosphatase